ncbi:MAG TPA: Asp-tRNA(Asn)/Glu-tRNA(Gln) amidotransferase subunit GatC [Candidatus Babeliales bacterium]|nr:Asp-tRNA(Asn)/Glu-tRNA(Gln) amidotransferase subunit GatC [Candidatus Babeliales bacterium]
MAKITKDELLKLARISQLDIHDDEIEPLLAQLDSVLSYAARVKEVPFDYDDACHGLSNVFRQDSVVQTNPESILALAPEREDNFFVVPRILESNS